MILFKALCFNNTAPSMDALSWYDRLISVTYFMRIKIITVLPHLVSPMMLMIGPVPNRRMETHKKGTYLLF